jgi:hypothetical protein
MSNMPLGEQICSCQRGIQHIPPRFCFHNNSHIHNIADQSQSLCHVSTDLVHPWKPEAVNDNMALASIDILL